MSGDSKENHMVREQRVRQEKGVLLRRPWWGVYIYSIAGENREALGFLVKIIVAAGQRLGCRGH